MGLKEEIRWAYDRGSYYYAKRLLAIYKKLIKGRKIGPYEL